MQLLSVVTYVINTEATSDTYILSSVYCLFILKKLLLLLVFFSSWSCVVLKKKSKDNQNKL